VMKQIGNFKSISLRSITRKNDFAEVSKSLAKSIFLNSLERNLTLKSKN